jgi:plastocyanin
MKVLRAALIVFVLAAFAVGGTALAKSAAGSAPSSQSIADDHGSGHGGDDGSGRHGGDDGDRSGHHGDDDGDDNGHHGDDGDDDGGTPSGTTTGTTTSTTSTTATGATTVVSRRKSSGTAAGKRLIGTVGPGFAITLRTPSGAVVRTLRAGTYTVVVRDRSQEHNFHLRGRGVDKATTVGSAATKTWTVKLAAGTFTYVCDPHASSMRGSLRVV